MFNQQSIPYVCDKLVFPVVKKTNCRPPPPFIPPNGCIDKAKIRKYPCGFPGCQWVFTRTNHVVRHHERVHPGFKPTHTTSRSNNHNSSSSSNTIANNDDNLRKTISTNSTTTSGLQQQVTTTSSSVSSEHGFKLREALTGFYLCYVTGCKQRFNTKNELNTHLFHVHSLVEPEVCIKVEGQDWNEENTTLLTNKLSDSYTSACSTSDRRYVCDAIGCDKAYTKNSHLIRHKEDSHNLLRPPHPLKFLRSPRPYACTLPGCDKTYTKNSHLIRHLVETHKMAKPAPKVNRRLTPNFGPPPTHLTPTPTNGGNGLLQISSSSSSSSSLSSSPSSAVTSTSISTPASSSTAKVPTSVNRSGEAPMIYNDRPYACTFPGCGWSFKRQYHLNRHIITHRMNNNRKDGNNRNQNNSKNSTNNQQNNINNINTTNNNMANLNTNLNNAADLTALINLARNLAAARAKSESISWIVLEDGDEEEDNSSDDQPPSTQLKDLSTRRHIAIEEDSFCCDFPGCGKMFMNSFELMQHYLGHSGPSSGLRLNSHLINSSAHLSQLLDEPPLECVLEEFDDDDDDDDDDIVVGGVNDDHHREDRDDEEDDDHEEDEDDNGGEEETNESINGHLNGLSINLSKNREFAKITSTDSD